MPQVAMPRAKGSAKAMITAVVSAETAVLQDGSADYVLAPDVILLLVSDGTARLLDLRGNFYAISATGATMLFETLRQGTVAAAHKIAAQYDVDIHQVRGDLQAFLEGLEPERLLHRPGPSPARHRPTSITPSLVLVPVLRCVHAWMPSVKARARALLVLAYISIRVFGLPRTLTVWRRLYHKIPHRHDVRAVEQTARAIDGAVRAAAADHPLRLACKERALCCWALLRFEGLPATLVLGVDLFPFTSHCWCQLGSLVLSDDEDRCQRFTAVLSYE
jgi:hypothetical protein